MGDLELPVFRGRRAAEIITEFLKEKDLTYTGGCKAFYTPEEWEEEHGRGSLLIVCHDGGELSNILNWDKHNGPEDAAVYQELLGRLEAEGMYFESCTCWYTAVYPIVPLPDRVRLEARQKFVEASEKFTSAAMELLKAWDQLVPDDAGDPKIITPYPFSNDFREKVGEIVDWNNSIHWAFREDDDVR